jgi:altronate dehydratase large subunit
MSFLGYPRKSGAVGVRNYVGVISVGLCANDVVWGIAHRVKDCVPFIHGQGCCQTKSDLDQVTRTLISLGWNPNLAAVLLVSLGCESVPIEQIAEGISQSGKTVETMVILKEGGITSALARGCQLTQAMAVEATKAKREEFPDSKLILGVKCGASDTTSGLISNPAAGIACDLLISKGGACVFGETTEFIGAEHVLAQRAATQQVGKKIMDIVGRMENRAIDIGDDLRGGQLTHGSVAGGLTTIEEKSLGAISKCGSKFIKNVYEYGERIQGKGLFIIDTPGREPEFLTGLAAAGAQVIVFTTGLGAPQGFPFVPVIKVTGNPNTYKRVTEHIDVFVEITDEAGAAVAGAGHLLYQEALAVASGKKTKAELLGIGNFCNIYTTGPTI